MVLLEEKTLVDAVHALETWFRRHARKLPWRRTHEPYVIWISEVMLQQTQVTTVIPYFEAFLGRFPTVHALADAPEEDVLTQWSGLGYYSRARNLHRGAKYIVDKYGGIFPRTREELLSVPGIGPYTAGAVLSIAFDLPESIVDGNVQRVFARYYGVRLDLKSSAAQKLFWEKAGEWVRGAGSPRAMNQALMELGATVCIKGSPRCDQCPLRTSCLSYQNGWQAELPLKLKRKNKVDLWWVSLVYRHGDKLFLTKNAKGEWWSDLWDFPRLDAGSEKAWRDYENRRGWKGLDFQKHTVTHHRIHLAPYLVDQKEARPPVEREGRWFTRAQLTSLPLSSLAKKIVRATI